ncbi:MAG TPA: LysM domain-containing protein [Gaiellaceae bacterium]
MREDWRRYVAPAAFLLAVTVAVVLIRSGLESGGANVAATLTSVPTTTRKHVVTTTPTTTAPSAATTTPSAHKAYWTVQAGDTFGVISSKTGVPVATIEQLNPNTSSTSLFIGQKIRYR